MRGLTARAGLVLLWLLHWLPLPVLAPLGRALGTLLWGLAGDRRRIALRNLELCFPEKTPAERRRLAFEHFQYLGRSLLERSLLWHASPERLRRLIHVEGPVGFADAHAGPVMWLAPHFLGLDVAAVGIQLHVARPGCSIYQTQSNPVIDAALRRARLRFGGSLAFSRREPPSRCCAPSRRASASSTCRTWTSAARTPPSCPSSACRPPRCWRPRAWRACSAWPCSR